MYKQNIATKTTELKALSAGVIQEQLTIRYEMGQVMQTYVICDTLSRKGRGFCLFHCRMTSFG